MRNILRTVGRSLGCTVTVMGCALGAIGSILPVNAAPGAGWVRVVTDEGNNIWYVDKGTLRGTGQYRFFWTYVSMAMPMPISNSSRMIDGGALYVSVDCKTLIYRMRHVQVVDQNSKVIEESDLTRQSSANKLLPNDRTGKAIVKAACSNRR